MFSLENSCEGSITSTAFLQTLVLEFKVLWLDYNFHAGTSTGTQLVLL